MTNSADVAAIRYLSARGWTVARRNDPTVRFRSNHYLEHNARRLEHLASLGIRVAGRSVLEVGAGIGDHSGYYLQRGCRLVTTEINPQNLRLLRQRFPLGDIRRLDLDHPAPLADGPFEVAHCYGVLYHLARPEQAIAFLASLCSELMFVESCVSFGEADAVNAVGEDDNNPTQSSTGTGCRPTRRWLFERLRRHFEHVYLPLTQPNHPEFPLDWTRPELHAVRLQRAIFVAARHPLDIPSLTESLVERQERHA